MSELKPCQFCRDGGKPELYFEFGYGFIGCTVCRARGPQKNNPGQAVEAWNTRTPAPEQPATEEGEIVMRGGSVVYGPGCHGINTKGPLEALQEALTKRETQAQAEPVTEAHIANEWADMATNGLQWLKNVRDGISTPEDGIAEMQSNCERIQNLRRRAQPQQSAEQHPDDIAVDQFAAAMKEKLAKKRAQGRDGWQECPPEDLSTMLVKHIAKGDPVDVANFAMMLHQTGNKLIASESDYFKALRIKIDEQPQRAAVPDDVMIQRALDATVGAGENVFWSIVFGLNNDSDEVRQIMAKEIVRTVLLAAAKE